MPELTPSQAPQKFSEHPYTAVGVPDRRCSLFGWEINGRNYFPAVISHVEIPQQFHGFSRSQV
jgi:hypothetical protein